MENMILFTISLLLICNLDYLNGQVAPGVPPQRYQAPPPPQHQVPVQQQHIPMQQQQQAQMQQQVPMQQVPVQQQVPIQQYQQQPIQGQEQGHHHGHGAPQAGQLLNAQNIQHEKEHIAEHMDVPIDTSKMSDQELQFHYFKMHDADNNNKLDGCELIKSLIHWHEQGNKDPNSPHKVDEKVFKDQELVDLIDPILKMDDLNSDGYIDYPEFIRAQQKASQTNNNQV